MKYIIYTLLFTILTFLSNSCIFIEPDIPELTTTGEYIFAFRVNGEVAGLNKDRRGLDFHNSFDEFAGGLLFQLGDENRHEKFILFSKENIYAEGIYTADGSKFHDNNLDSCKWFRTFVSGYIDIQHLDTEENIISGYFEVTLSNDCGDIVEITDGVFVTGYHL